VPINKPSTKLRLAKVMGKFPLSPSQKEAQLPQKFITIISDTTCTLWWKIALQLYVFTLLHKMFRKQSTTGDDTYKRAAKISFHVSRKNNRNICHPYNHCTPGS